jgi:hypothetical protein
MDNHLLVLDCAVYILYVADVSDFIMNIQVCKHRYAGSLPSKHGYTMTFGREAPA